jgi:hypothetical protein
MLANLAWETCSDQVDRRFIMRMQMIGCNAVIPVILSK